MKTGWFAAGGALFVAVLAGCASDSMAPDVRPEVARAEAVAAQEGDAVEQWLGSEGGVLSIPGATLTVMPGSVGQATRFGMTRRSDGSVELSPHGIRFKTPVRLAFDLPSDGAKGTVTVEWFDPIEERWVPIPSVASETSCGAPLQHFSLYRLARLQ